MDPIIKRLMENRLEDSNLYEMANINKSRTGLPYDIWVDSAGSSRIVKHNSPRLKIDVDGELIPFSISEHPEILVNKNISNQNEEIKFIQDNNEIFIKHWNGEIDDGQIINYLTLIYKKGISREEAYSRLADL